MFQPLQVQEQVEEQSEEVRVRPAPSAPSSLCSVSIKPEQQDKRCGKGTMEDGEHSAEKPTVFHTRKVPSKCIAL